MLDAGNFFREKLNYERTWYSQPVGCNWSENFGKNVIGQKILEKNVTGQKIDYS